jgi:hypothetical protein
MAAPSDSRAEQFDQREAEMGGSIADLVVVLQLVSGPKGGGIGHLYAAHWERPVPEHEPRWRKYAAAGLMALARRIAPITYETQLHRGADLAGAGAGSV